MVNNWHNSVKELKENHIKELEKCRNINDEVCVFNKKKNSHFVAQINVDVIFVRSYFNKIMIFRQKLTSYRI